MADLEKQSRRFGSAFSSTIKSAIIGSRSFEDTLRTLALRLSGIALSAGLKPLENLASNFFQNLFSGFSGSFGSSAIGPASPSSVIPFARGGVVAAPTFFAAGQSLGVMGEAGAEAVLPLARGGDGRLGVRTQGNGGAINVVFNVSTPDVQGFRQSEGQISTMLARTVSRGRRGL